MVLSRTPAERLWFNNKNQLARADDADGVSRLFLYDGIGDLQYAVVDLNQNHGIDLGGADEVVASRAWERGGRCLAYWARSS